MRKTQAQVLLVALALIVLALPAAAKEHVFVDYDREVDFSKFETFMYAPAKKGMLAQDPLVDDYIVKGLIRRLRSGGMKQVDADADLLITYEISSQTGQRVNVTGFTFYGGSSWGWGSGFGAGYGYGGGGWYIPTTMMTTYKSGTIFIAGFDTSTEMGIWRGAGEIVNVRSPAKAFKKVDKSLNTMMEKWHQMRDGE